MGWVGPREAALLVSVTPTSVGRRHEELVLAAVAVGVVDDARCGFSGSVGAPVFRAGVENRSVYTPSRSTTNLAT